MLRTLTNIGEALERSTATEFPLLVIVTAALPDMSHLNALEATRTTARYSFLPGHLPTAASSDECTSGGVNHIVDPFNKENATLGVLRAANSFGLNGSFPLASVRGGAAQKEALSVTLLESKLGNVCFIHWVEEGTPAYEQFSAVGGQTPTGTPPTVPRVHVFSPATRGWQSIVIGGDLLTPLRLKKAVLSALQLTPATLPTLKQQFLENVEEMNRETRRRQMIDRAEQVMAARPILPTAHTSPPAAEIPRPAVPAMHILHVDGLPNRKRKSILSNNCTTLRTVWNEVCQHLRSLEAAVSEAKAAGDWDGVTYPAPDGPIILVVEDDKGKELTRVSSVEAAEVVKVQAFPSGALVRVVLPSWQQPSLPHESAVEPQSQAPLLKPDTSRGPAGGANNVDDEVLCDGNTCRRRTHQLDSLGAPPTSPTAEEVLTSPVTPSIAIRLSLPDGRTESVRGLDPTVHTLRSQVRPTVAALLGHSKFYFAVTYPNKRIDVETEEGQPLEAIGLRSSAALRVVATEVSERPASATNRVTADGRYYVSPAEAASGSGILHQLTRLMGRVPVIRPTGASTHSVDPASKGAPSTTHGPPARSPLRSNVATLDNYRDPLEDMAPQQQPGSDQANAAGALQALIDRMKKSNRYFGGNSTEFIAEDDSAGEDGELGNAQSGTEEHAARRAFTGEGRRLAMGGASAPPVVASGQQPTNAGDTLKENDTKE